MYAWSKTSDMFSCALKAHLFTYVLAYFVIMWLKAWLERMRSGAIVWKMRVVQW